MERTIELSPKEIGQMGQMEQENLRLNARYGAMRRESDNLEKLLSQSEEAQRAFIRLALVNHGVENFMSAKIEPGRIVYTIPDEAPAPPQPNGVLAARTYPTE